MSQDESPGARLHRELRAAFTVALPQLGARGADVVAAAALRTIALGAEPPDIDDIGAAIRDRRRHLVTTVGDSIAMIDGRSNNSDERATDEEAHDVEGTIAAFAARYGLIFFKKSSAAYFLRNCSTNSGRTAREEDDNERGP